MTECAMGQSEPVSAPAVIRPWNSDIHDATDRDLGGPQAISMVGARGGAFSGKITVGASGPPGPHAWHHLLAGDAVSVH